MGLQLTRDCRPVNSKVQKFTGWHGMYFRAEMHHLKFRSERRCLLAIGLKPPSPTHGADEQYREHGHGGCQPTKCLGVAGAR